MKILFDLIATQPLDGLKTMEAQNIQNACIEQNINLISVKSTSEIETLLQERNYDKFFQD